MPEIIHKKESYAIIGACFEVYNDEPDYVCFEKIIVELKAVSALTDEHRAQLLNYLHATGLELGLLVNFGHYPKLEYGRIAKTQRIKPKTDPSDVSL